MTIACPLCGAALGEAGAASLESSALRCPSCGARVEQRRLSEGGGDGGPDTVFQPRLPIDDGVSRRTP